MKNLLISGSSGKVGLYVRKLAKDYDFNVVCGVDKNNFCEADFPVYKTFSEVKENVDVIIDFSSPDLAEAALDFAENYKAKLVCGTTALKKSFYEKSKRAAEKIIGSGIIRQHRPDTSVLPQGLGSHDTAGNDHQGWYLGH